MKKSVEVLRAIGRTVAVAYVGLAALMYLAQEKLIFPLPLPADPGRDVQVRSLSASDGVKLSGGIREGRSERRRVILYFGGNGEDTAFSLSNLPWPSDWTVVSFNYRSYGSSEGKPSEQALFADALQVHDTIVQQWSLEPRDVVLMGRSLGSGVATYLASQRQVGGVVLVTPYDSVRAVAQAAYPWLPVGLLLRHPFDSLSRAPTIHTPMLALTAGTDTVIPYPHSRRLLDAWAGPKQEVIINEGDHNSLLQSPVFWRSVADWLTPR